MYKLFPNRKSMVLKAFVSHAIAVVFSAKDPATINAQSVRTACFY